MRHNVDTPVPQGPVLSLAVSFDPEHFRAAIYRDPEGQRLWHDRATLDPRYDKVAAQPAQGTSKWVYTRQNTLGYLAQISPADTMRRYIDSGQLETGDVVVTVMPDEINLGDHDLITPLGRTDAPGNPDAVTLEQKTVLIRGGTLVPQTGTVTNAGPTLTGTGTSFLTTLLPGDIVSCSGQGLRIVSVASDTILTLESAPTAVWNGNKFSKGVDLLERDPQGVDDARDLGAVYRPGVDFALSGDQRAVQWRSLASPTPGSRYSVVYRYYPKYTVLGDLGSRQHGAGGVPMPRTFHCRMVGKDDEHR